MPPLMSRAEEITWRIVLFPFLGFFFFLFLYFPSHCLFFIDSRLHQKRATSIEDEIINLFSKVSYFGVYDGHGGVRAADYLQEHLHHRICNSEAFARGDFEIAIKDGFRKTDEEFLKLCKEKYYMDGSTCCVAMIIDNKLITAHAGKKHNSKFSLFKCKFLWKKKKATRERCFVEIKKPSV